MTGKIPKLLRTLIEYDADLLIIPSGFHPRIQHEKKWHEVLAHPPLSSDEILTAARDAFGEISLSELESGKSVSSVYKGIKLEVTLQKLSDGMILMVRKS